MIYAVRTAVNNVLAEERFPLVIGGDCPLLLGCLAAARDIHNRIAMLFVDGLRNRIDPDKHSAVHDHIEDWAQGVHHSWDHSIDLLSEASHDHTIPQNHRTQL